MTVYNRTAASLTDLLQGWGTPMKTLTVDDRLYSAIEAEADKSGRPVGDLITEAIEAWLVDSQLDGTERAEIEAARVEAAEKGGVEFEGFFDDLLRDTT